MRALVVHQTLLAPRASWHRAVRGGPGAAAAVALWFIFHAVRLASRYLLRPGSMSRRREVAVPASPPPRVLQSALRPEPDRDSAGRHPPHRSQRGDPIAADHPDRPCGGRGPGGDVPGGQLHARRHRAPHDSRRNGSPQWADRRDRSAAAEAAVDGLPRPTRGDGLPSGYPLSWSPSPPWVVPRRSCRTTLPLSRPVFASLCVFTAAGCWRWPWCAAARWWSDCAACFGRAAATSASCRGRPFLTA